MLHSFLILNYLFIFLGCLWAPLNDWVPWACCYMISGGIKYIAGICFPPLSGLDDTADKYSSSKVEEPRQQNKYVLHFIILIASSCLVGVEWKNSRLRLFCVCPVRIMHMRPYDFTHMYGIICMMNACVQNLFLLTHSLPGEGFNFGSNKIDLKTRHVKKLLFYLI